MWGIHEKFPDTSRHTHTKQSPIGVDRHKATNLIQLWARPRTNLIAEDIDMNVIIGFLEKIPGFD